MTFSACTACNYRFEKLSGKFWTHSIADWHVIYVHMRAIIELCDSRLHELYCVCVDAFDVECGTKAIEQKIISHKRSSGVHLFVAVVIGCAISYRERVCFCFESFIVINLLF